MQHFNLPHLNHYIHLRLTVLSSQTFLVTHLLTQLTAAVPECLWVGVAGVDSVACRIYAAKLWAGVADKLLSFGLDITVNFGFWDCDYLPVIFWCGLKNYNNAYYQWKESQTALVCFIPFYSILFYPILFYSTILFYSILFHSILSKLSSTFSHVLSYPTYHIPNPSHPILSYPLSSHCKPPNTTRLSTCSCNTSLV